MSAVAEPTSYRNTRLVEALQVDRSVQQFLKRLVVATNQRADGEQFVLNGCTVVLRFRKQPRSKDEQPRDPYLVVMSAQISDEVDLRRPISRTDLTWVLGVGHQSGAVIVGTLVRLLKRLLDLVGAEYTVVSAIVTLN